MRKLLILLASVMITTGSLCALEYSVVKFEPPIHFNANGFKQVNDSEWAMAFLGRKAPGEITYAEFNETISDTIKKKFGFDEEAFHEMVARAPKSDAYGSILAEVKFRNQDEEFMMLIIHPMELIEYPQSKDDVSGFMSKLFFKKVNGHWIAWMMPHDLAYDDPMTNIDIHEALGVAE